TDFYRSQYQKRKDKICPFSILAFLQPTTVDKEPFFVTSSSSKSLIESKSKNKFYPTDPSIS
ncbi:MAG: hypothetical protein KHX89_05630, partial [Streptococcus mitis]|nr:hypothetical protein [Streptococcus mitis]